MTSQREPSRRPRLLFIITFFSFFVGIQMLMVSFQVLGVLLFSGHAQSLEDLRESTVFTQSQLVLYVLYQIGFSLVLLASAYVLLFQLKEGARRILKGTYIVDVFLFLGILLYYSHLEYRPPDRDVFYTEVFSKMFEILLIICLSHPMIIESTQARLRRDSDRGKEGKSSES